VEAERLGEGLGARVRRGCCGGAQARAYRLLAPHMLLLALAAARLPPRPDPAGPDPGSLPVIPRPAPHRARRPRRRGLSAEHTHTHAHKTHSHAPTRKQPARKCRCCGAAALLRP